MKKIFKIAIGAVVLLMLLGVVVNATTKSELEAYLLESHNVAGKEVSLTEANKVKVKRYLADNEITDEQATAIKAKVDELLKFMDKAGVSDVNQLSSEQKKEALAIANEALAIIGLKATYNSSDKTVDIYKDGKKIDSVSTETGKLLQTGSDNTAWIVVVSVSVIALIAVVAIKKVKNND